MDSAELETGASSSHSREAGHREAGHRDSDERPRTSKTPSQMKGRNLWRIFSRVKESVGDDKLSIVAGGGATKAVVQALNVAYGKEENRGFLRLNLFTLVLTLVAILGFIFAAAAVILAPVLLQYLAYVLLLGAEVNSEAESEVLEDTGPGHHGMMHPA